MYKGCRTGKPQRGNGKLFTVRTAVMDGVRSRPGLHSQLQSLRTSGLSKDTEVQLLPSMCTIGGPQFPLSTYINMNFPLFKVVFKEVFVGMMDAPPRASLCILPVG